MELISRATFNSYLPWHFFFVLIQLLLLAIFKLNNGITWGQLARNFVRVNPDSETRKNFNAQSIFILLGWINISFSISLIAQQLGNPPFQLSPWMGLLVCLIIVPIWLVSYIFLFNLGAWVTQENAVFNFLRASLVQLFCLWGLLGIPFNVILIFAPKDYQIIAQVLFISLIIFGLIRRLFMGTQMAIHQRISAWYLILYLCALEIMPFLCLAKLAA
ncbi:MAG: DUF4271 domain-containing protein [Luteibaculum sp.]